MKPKDEILGDSVCPSEQLLKQYAAGKLSGLELRAVELHIAGCEMCSDMAEGFAVLKPEEFEEEKQKLIAMTHKLSDKRLGFLSIIFSKRNVMIAASLTLIISGLFFMYRYFQAELKDEKLAMHQDEEMPVKDTDTSIKKQTNAESANEIKTVIIDTPIKNIETYPVTESLQEISVSKEEANTDIKYLGLEKAQEKPSVARELNNRNESTESRNVNSIVTTGQQSVVSEDENLVNNSSPKVNFEESAEGTVETKQMQNMSLDAVTVSSKKSRRKDSKSPSSLDTKDNDLSQNTDCQFQMKLAKVHLQNDDVKQAQKVLKQMRSASCQSDAAKLQIMLARYYKQKNEKKQAASYYKEAIKSNDDELKNEAQQGLDSLNNK